MHRIAIACLALGTIVSVTAKDVHVSPRGNDANPGTREKPFASLGKAVAVMAHAGGGTIWLAEGEYYVGNGITLTKMHSGSKAHPLTIRSEVPLKARITGARRVVDFTPISPADAKGLISPAAKTHVLVADLKAQGFPPLAPMPSHFRAPGVEEVFFGDLPMQPARWPNSGFATFTQVIDSGASAPTHWVSRKVYRPGAFRFPSDRPAHWNFSRGVYLHGFWCYDWSDETLKAASFNPATRELRLAAKAPYGIGSPYHRNSPRRFYAVYVFAELDCPGEYYLDRTTNKLYFWPPGDVTKTPVRVSLCRAPLISATGVANLVLRDVVLEDGAGWGIRLRDCTDTTVENCLVRNMALGGISSQGGHDDHVLRSEVTRTGSLGVRMDAGDRKTLTNGNCSVVGNHLHHLGRYDWGGGRGVILGGCGNLVANNLIDHCPTGGIAYSGNQQLLELNEVYDVCTLYSDVGVFYTGRDWASRGNVVRWNYIHDITNRSGSGSNAIYLDDCDSGDTVVGNIVFGGVGRGVLIGGGRDNTIEGNLFIDLPKGIHVDARGPRAITLDKPGSWNLLAKCEKLGYQSPLWRKRYPRLARVMQDHPLLPMGNVIRGNIFVGCRKALALTRGVKKEWLTLGGNVEFKATDFPFIPADPKGKTLDLSKLPQIWKSVPGFKPIPYEKIGPKGL